MLTQEGYEKDQQPRAAVWELRRQGDRQLLEMLDKSVAAISSRLDSIEAVLVELQSVKRKT